MAVDIGNAGEQYARRLSRGREITVIMTLCMQKQFHADAVMRSCRVRPPACVAELPRLQVAMTIGDANGGTAGMD